MKKKGFTLVEMLTTVAILGVIVIIVAPNITGLLRKIHDDKYKRFLNDIYIATEAYIQANSKKYSEISTPGQTVFVYISELVNSGYLKSDMYDPKTGKTIIQDIESGDFTVEAENSDSEYKYYLHEYRVRTGPSIDLSDIYSSLNVKQSGVKGVVYLDPTNLSHACTKISAGANLNNYGTPTEIKSGCMKWYIFDDSGNDYTMILDHNVVARIKWCTSNCSTITSYDNSSVKIALDDLVTVYGWKVTPRNITGQEIANIINYNEWTASNHWIYMENLSQENPGLSNLVNSKYAWLYNYLNSCHVNGCEYEDNNSYNMYISTTSGTSGYTSAYYTGTKHETNDSISGADIYIVNYNNRFTFGTQGTPYWGIRPVIAVPKSLFE